MTPDERQKQKNQLRAIRNRVDLAPDNWKMNFSDTAIELQASPSVSMDKDDPFPVTYATLAQSDTEVAQFLFSAHTDLIFLLGLFDRAAGKIVEMSRAGGHNQNTSGPSKNYSSQCAIACGKQSFQKYIIWSTGLHTASLTTKETGQLVAWLLGIKTRSLINDEPESWLTMNSEFQEWLRQ